MALLRKLHALGYPHADGFQVENGLRNLVVWLEDTKICHYPMTERESLRDINSPDWSATFVKYLSDLGCPYATNAVQSDMKVEVLDWLLGLGVRLHYSDDAETFAEATASALDGGPAVVCDLPAESLSEVAALLKLPQHEDPTVLLHAITSVLKSKFSSASLAAAVAAKNEPKQEISLADMQLGFSTGDPAVDRACKVLRLLHIADLRDLQTRVNELIVKVQSSTADPKTNIKLGRVGR